MLFKNSKYAEVRAAHEVAEINALHAYVPKQGIGTAIIHAAETIAADWSRSAIGLAVGPDNHVARRLYERLGYQPWGAPGDRHLDRTRCRRQRRPLARGPLLLPAQAVELVLVFAQVRRRHVDRLGGHLLGGSVLYCFSTAGSITVKSSRLCGLASR